MLIFRRLFRFYIHASIHVALAVISLYALNAQNLNISINVHVTGFLFFATIVCYNFVKYGVEADKYLVVAKPSHKPIQVFSFLAFGICLYFFFLLPVQFWVVIGVLTVISALYAIPFLPSSRNLRSLGGLKIFLVALVWVGFTVVLPAVEHQLGFSKQVLSLAIQNYVLVLILIVPFEIRDLEYDKPELRTLPQRFGVSNSKHIGYALSLVFLSLRLVGDGWDLKRTMYSLAVFGVLVAALYFTKEGQSKYYTSFWVEGIPIFLLLVYSAMDRLI